MIAFKKDLIERIHKRLQRKYPLEISMVEFQPTPQLKMGDLALTFPLSLAKKMAMSSRELADKIISLLVGLEGVTRIEVAGPGYINFFIDRGKFFVQQLRSLHQSSLLPEEDKIIIEHTNINPNKAAHIGHLRNAVLGDTLGRCLKHKGENVEIQNYIDDTGVQVADVVFGFVDLEQKGLEDVKKVAGKFDYYCWDLYARVSSFLEDHPEAQKRRSEILRNIEKGIAPEADIASYISHRIIKAHLETMKRIGIRYDLLPCESSILGLQFWDKAYSLLKDKEAIYYVDEGPNKGCWVMKAEGEEEKEKVIVRSDGTVTYVGKDIAYQLWKFGLLKQDFFYEPFIEDESGTTWITTCTSQETHPQFGQGTLVYNVIDARQSYLQKIVVQGLRFLNYHAQAEKSIHFSYEMVGLSPKSLKELDQEITEEDRDKNFLEVSGRKGLGVKADDLIDRLEEKARAEVDKRNRTLPPEEKKTIAHAIAVGALRYFMLKFARNSVIVFDIEEALSFEGETGPYLQYALVRINSIFRNLIEREGLDEKILPPKFSLEPLSLNVLPEEEQDDFWDMVFYASRYEEEIFHSMRSLEFSHLAKFVFVLCQKFNAYYHKYSILSEKDGKIKNIRILTITYIGEILKKTLSLMGIPQPEKM
jgi:arginyl-tRNA synthetase